MSPFDDHQDVTRRLDDRTADAVLSGHATDVEPELAAFALALRAVERPVPAPSAALAALLEAGLVGAVAPSAPRRPVRARAVTWIRAHWSLPLQAGLAGGACLALLVGGAAADTLPDPVQTAVADVVEAVTPLTVPRPPAPAPAPAVVPAEVENEPGDDGPTKGRGDEPEDDRQGRDDSDDRADNGGGDDHSADDGSGRGEDRSGSGRDERSGSGSDDRSGYGSPSGDDRTAPTTRPDDSSSGGSGGSGGGGRSGGGRSDGGSDDKGGSGGGSDD